MGGRSGTPTIHVNGSESCWARCSRRFRGEEAGTSSGLPPPSSYPHFFELKQLPSSLTLAADSEFGCCRVRVAEFTIVAAGLSGTMSRACAWGPTTPDMRLKQPSHQYLSKAASTDRLRRVALRYATRLPGVIAAATRTGIADPGAAWASLLGGSGRTRKLRRQQEGAALRVGLSVQTAALARDTTAPVRSRHRRRMVAEALAVVDLHPRRGRATPLTAYRHSRRYRQDPRDAAGCGADHVPEGRCGGCTSAGSPYASRRPAPRAGSPVDPLNDHWVFAAGVHKGSTCLTVRRPVVHVHLGSMARPQMGGYHEDPQGRDCGCSGRGRIPGFRLCARPADVWDRSTASRNART